MHNDNDDDKRDPLTQGSLLEIADVFLKPLLRFKPEDESTQRFLEEKIFHTDSRFIRRFVVRAPFMMPGLYKVADNVAYQGMGFRKIAAGTEMWVRTDDTMPDVIDVEISVGVGSEIHWYQLTFTEWNTIKFNLFRDHRNKHKI